MEAIFTYLREDLLEGARATWKTGNPKNLDCRGRVLWQNHTCSYEGFVALDSRELLENAPNSIHCSKSIASLDCK